MKMKSEQEIFDKVARHLLKQKQRAQGRVMCSDQDKTFCVYRTQGSGRVLHCAVGCLIPKRLYRFELEDGGIRDNSGVQAVLRQLGVDTDNEDMMLLLSDLQRLHDSAAVDTWRDELVILAGMRGLNTEVLNVD